MQVLVFLQEFIGLLDRHFIVAIIKVIWVQGETCEMMKLLTETIRMTCLRKMMGGILKTKT